MRRRRRRRRRRSSSALTLPRSSPPLTAPLDRREATVENCPRSRVKTVTEEVSIFLVFRQLLMKGSGKARIGIIC